MLGSIKEFVNNRWISYLKPFQDPTKTAQIAVAYSAISLFAGVTTGLALYYKNRLDKIDKELTNFSYYLEGIHDACDEIIDKDCSVHHNTYGHCDHYDYLRAYSNGKCSDC